MSDRPARKPDWLRAKIGQGPRFNGMRDLVRRRGLHTVCEEALCPNMGSCWEHGRATIMILGDTCTRNCRFCGVGTGNPGTRDLEEPGRVAAAVKEMGLSDVVLTSVTRDDLDDGGASIWAGTITQIRQAVPGIVIEVLVPDFQGSRDAFEAVAQSCPDVFGHNLETVPEMYPEVRPQADYTRSLELLERAHKAGMITKTGIMVGVGETSGQVHALFKDVVAAGVDIFYAGQYLQPTKDHLPVARYVEPGEFEMYREAGLRMGLGVVVSGPLVRSSYHADEQTVFVKERLKRND